MLTASKTNGDKIAIPASHSHHPVITRAILPASARK